MGNFFPYPQTSYTENIMTSQNIKTINGFTIQTSEYNSYYSLTQPEEYIGKQITVCKSYCDIRKYDIIKPRTLSIPIYADDSRIQTDSDYLNRMVQEARFIEDWVDVKKIPLNFFEILITFGYDKRIACFKLLSSRLRSPFKKSLKKQLLNWLKTDIRKNSPFSDKQWNCLTKKYSHY